MAIDIQMPQLGESVTEGTIVKWLKKPGDSIAKYEPICEVSTDKVNAEVPATIAGTMVEIIAEEGTVLQVGQPICRIQAGEMEQRSNEASDPLPLQGRYSPAVLRLAAANQIDLTLLRGTGKGGRVTRKDVLRVLEVNSEATAAREESRPIPTVALPTVASVPTSAKATEVVLEDGDVEVPLTAVRRTIAQRMVQSKHEVPHAWMMMEADVTPLVALRHRLKDSFERREGFNLTFMPFFIKAVVDSLKQFPYLNSVWAEDKIILKKRIHISMAVATENALYVPVIHDVDEKSILGLAKAVNRLVQKTRAGKLELKDMTGGTFTVNNTGSFGSIASAPIINFTNYPQAAILSFEAIVKRPVIYNHMIAIRDKMNLCLSLDHRILDGWLAGKFLQHVKKSLEAYGTNDADALL
jgi:2-oxoisovalerate dehydrogenase E2 component (dihydrolipoyl transacylase)